MTRHRPAFLFSALFLACFRTSPGTIEPPECPASKEAVMTAVVYRDGIEGYHWECRAYCPTGQTRELVFEARETEIALAERRRRGVPRETRPLTYACIPACPEGSAMEPLRHRDEAGEHTTYRCSR
jgi:hypothetical protein